MAEDIRNITRADLADLKSVIESSGLFPPEMLDDMTKKYFDNADSGEIWLTKTVKSKPVALAYGAPEQLTEGTYNLYLIAVHAQYQGSGMGGQLMKNVEELLKSQKTRILIVETSGLPEYELTRKFYEKQGYTK